VARSFLLLVMKHSLKNNYTPSQENILFTCNVLSVTLLNIAFPMLRMSYQQNAMATFEHVTSCVH